MAEEDEKPTVGADDTRGKDEDILDRILGKIGRYQFCLYALIFVARFPVEFQLTNVVFLLPPAEYICLDDGLNVTNLCPCASPEYDTSVFYDSVIMSWDLICENKWWSSLTQSMLQAGVLIGSIIFGYISDRFGRKVALVTAMLLTTIAAFLTSFASQYWWYLVLRTCTGAGVGGTMLTAFVISIEFSTKNARHLISGIDQAGYIIAFMVLPAMAYGLRNWRSLQLYCSAPWIFVLGYYWLLPESPRWLLAKGHTDRAIVSLTKIAKWNQQSTEHIETLVLEYQKQTSATVKVQTSFKDLYSSRHILKNTTFVSLLWACCALAFFGISQYMGRISGDIFLNIFIVAVLHVPGIVIAMIAMRLLKRKTALYCTLALATLCLLSMVFVPVDSGTIRLILGCVGQISMFNSFVTTYLYSSEIFPTVVRNSALGVASVAARIGAFVAPFIVDIGIEVVTIPIFAGAALFGIVFVSLLPETKNKKLNNTMSEYEEGLNR